MCWRETEFAHHDGSRCRRAKLGDADDRALETDVALPPERRGRLDAHPRADGRRKNGITVRLRLSIEQLPAGIDTTRLRMPSPASLACASPGCPEFAR